jgi:hypothetical protein
LQLKKKLNFFLLSKTTIYLSIGLHKERPKKPSDLKRGRPTLQNMNFKKNFYFCGSFSLSPGSGSTDPIESGPNPDPQHCFQASGKQIVWKRQHQGVREMCDVCSTSIFDLHFTCSRQGWKKPGFLKKKQPSGFFGFYWVFFGFIGFFWVLLGLLVFLVFFIYLP